MIKMKQSKEDVIFSCVTYSLAIIILLIVLYPLIFVLSASFSNPLSLVKGKVWLLPVGFSLDAYKNVLSNANIVMGYKNTIIYTVVGTAVNIIMTIAGAYPLSRKDFRGRNFIVMFFTFTMFFSGGMIPTYLLIKKLHLYNNFWVMILPSAISMWNLLIMRNYFQNSVPEEIIEAASVDGCTNVGTLIRIVLPVSKAIVAVMVIFYVVGHWNAYFNALLYLNDRAKYPLQVVLRDILIAGRGGLDGKDPSKLVDSVNDLLIFETLKYAIIVVASIPVLILYPMLQKYFIQGVMLGSVKG